MGWKGSSKAYLRGKEVELAALIFIVLADIFFKQCNAIFVLIFTSSHTSDSFTPLNRK